MQTPLVIFQVQGITCGHCVSVIRHTLRGLPGVRRVEVHRRTGVVKMWAEGSAPTLEALNALLQPQGYAATKITAAPQQATPAVSHPSMEQVMLAAFGLLMVLLVWKNLGLDQTTSGIGADMGLWAAAGAGLLASLSTCMASAGALVMAMARRHGELSPHDGLRGLGLPLGLFHLGRVAAYGVGGAVLGLLGQRLLPQSWLLAALSVGVGLLMAGVGLQLAGLWPRQLTFNAPWTAALGRLTDYCVDGAHPMASAGLGALTFFLPCGFTQSLQLVALGAADPLRGGAIMALFALGTMPGLSGLGVLMGAGGPRVSRGVGLVGGMLVVVMGLGNIRGGLVMLGLAPPPLMASAQAAPPARPVLQNGQQVVDMRVQGLRYIPSRFAVQKGVPVKWRIHAEEAAGCARVLEAPALGLRRLLGQQETVITFTPKKNGETPFFCSMGMTTPGAAFLVGDQPTARLADPARTPAQATAVKKKSKYPPTATQRRKARLLWGGTLVPKEFMVQKGVPVTLTIQSDFTPFGCLSGFAIPDLNVIQAVKKGKTDVTFTPHKVGKFAMMCHMEMIHYGTLEVTP